MRGLIAVVTGANKGLGLAVTKRLLKEGARVVLTARDPANESVAKKLKEEGLDVDFHQLDVTNKESVSKFVGYMQKTYNKCNILCNNAGMYSKGWNADAFQKIMQTNLIGPIDFTEEMLPLLKAAGKGTIVNVSSGLGKLTQIPEYYRNKINEANDLEALKSLPFDEKEGNPNIGFGTPCYNISKAAMNRWTLLLSQRLQKEGFKNILVNSADPGWCKTDMGGQSAIRSAEQGADSIFYCANLEDESHTGKFFFDGKEKSL